LRGHFLKVEAAAWLDDGTCVCDQCTGEEKHVQNEVHARLFCQDHRVCVLSTFFEDFSAAQPFLLQQVTNHDFLRSRTIDLFFIFLSLCIIL
jgi:hypothetical protein